MKAPPLSPGRYRDVTRKHYELFLFPTTINLTFCMHFNGSQKKIMFNRGPLQDSHRHNFPTLCIKHIIWIIEARGGEKTLQFASIPLSAQPFGSLQRFIAFSVSFIHFVGKKKNSEANELRMRNGKLCNSTVAEERGARIKAKLWGNNKKFKFTVQSPTFFAFRARFNCHPKSRSAPSSLILHAIVRKHYVGSFW